jgi:hypothetical protein
MTRISRCVSAGAMNCPRGVGHQLRVHARILRLHLLQRAVEQRGGVIQPVGDDRDKNGEDHRALDQRAAQLLQVLEEAHRFAALDRGSLVVRGDFIIFIHWGLLAQDPTYKHLSPARARPVFGPVPRKFPVS